MDAHSDLAVVALAGQDGELPPRDVSLQRGQPPRGIAVLGLAGFPLEPCVRHLSHDLASVVRGTVPRDSVVPHSETVVTVARVVPRSVYRDARFDGDMTLPCKEFDLNWNVIR